MAKSATAILYSHSERVAAVVDGAPLEGVGGSRLFIIEPGEPTEVPMEARNFIMAYLAYTGVVEVEVTKTKEGSTNNIDKAMKESVAKLSEFDGIRFRNWVNSVIDDYIKRNKPVPPPTDAMLAVINRGNFDPKKFGIVPIGWEDPEKNGRIAQLETEKGLLQTQLADLASKVDLLTTIVAQQQSGAVAAGVVAGKK